MQGHWWRQDWARPVPKDAMLFPASVYWAVVYFVARKYFGFSREWAAPLASGISICGLSAAIATGGAVKARPVVLMLASSLVLIVLVVIFAMVKLLILPFLGRLSFGANPSSLRHDFHPDLRIFDLHTKISPGRSNSTCARTSAILQRQL